MASGELRVGPYARAVVAGSCAGVAALAVVHPIDVIRIRLQASLAHSTALASARDLYRREGNSFRGFYRGLLPPLAAQAVYKSVLFVSYNGSQDLIRWRRGIGDRRPLALSDLFLCGAVAGGMNAFVTTPVELVRLALVTDASSVVGAGGGVLPGAGAPGAPALARVAAAAHRGSGSMTTARVVRDVVRRDGLTGLWRGHVATLARDVPGIGVWYCVFEAMRRKLSPRDGSPPALPAVFLAGACSGVCFWSVSLPFDTLKVQMQGDAAGQYRGLLDCLRKYVAARGVGALWRGWQVALPRGVPGSGVLFAVNEFVDRALCSAGVWQ